jgi:hypothetical protein
MTTLSLLRTEIHQSRQSCGKKLQQTYGILLEMFSCVLTHEMKVSHPYQLNETQLCNIDRKTKLFSLGGIGSQATLSGGKYIYRIFNKGHLPNYMKFRWPSFNNKPNLLWNFLRGKSKEGTEWINLQDYALNNYPENSVNCWFDCTWWTTYPLDEDVILGAYTIGMFSEWITNEVFVIRALIEQIDSLGVARVPTVIDAFMQPVFLPTKEPPSPDFGTTINLYDYNNLVSGVAEIAVNPFGVKFIEIKPLKVEPEKRQRYPAVSKDDPQVLQSLLSYYDAL